MDKMIQNLETLYRETGNPLFLWEAISDSPSMPDWCMDYIKNAAHDIARLSHDTDKSPSEKTAMLPSLLKLTSHGKNAFREKIAIDQDANIASWYEANLRRGEKAESLYRLAADELHCDISTVKRAIRRCRERWDAQRRDMEERK